MSNRQSMLAPNVSSPCITGAEIVTIALATKILSVVASRVTDGRGTPQPDDGATEAHRESLVDELLSVVASVNAVDRSSFLEHVEAFGITPEEVVDVYIPEAARRLGKQWETDESSFTDVSIGTARLQSMVREISAEWRADDASVANAPNILMVVPQGEDHTLGVMVAACQFRRLGVSVRMLLAQPDADVLSMAQSRPFDMIAVALSHADRIETVRKLIKMLKSSPVPMPQVVVGGPMQSLRDDLKRVTGADHICSDAADALRLCGIRHGARDASKMKDQV